MGLRMLRYYFALTAILIPILSGCTSVPDSDYRNELLKDQLKEGWVTESEFDLEFTGANKSLYEQIKSDELKHLIDEALVANLEIHIAANRVAALGFIVGEGRAAMIPDLNASLSKSRGKQRQLDPGFPSKVSSTYQADLSMSWEIDLWGRLRYQAYAAGEELQSATWDYTAAQHSITSLVVRLWLSLWSLEKQIQIESERLTLLLRLESAIKDRYRSGLGQLQDLSLAQLTANSSRANIDQLHVLLDETQRKLETVLGRYPSGDIQFEGPEPSIMRPIIGIPATVLANRPDIQSAFSKVLIEHYREKAAFRALLPDITLTGTLFRTAGAFNDLDASANYWSMIAGVGQSLFLSDLVGGGRISATDAIYWEKQAAINAYRLAVLNAMYEVETGLNKEQRLMSQKDHLATAYKNAQTAFSDYRERYSNGLVSVLDLINVQTQSLEIQVSLTETTTELLLNRVTLGLAAGVGVSTNREYDL